MGCQVWAPRLTLLQQRKQIILVMEDQEGVDFFFDFDVAAHGQIDHCAGDVAGMNGVADQGSGFGGTQAFRRLVLRGNGDSGIGIASHGIPEAEHYSQREKR